MKHASICQIYELARTSIIINNIRLTLELGEAKMHLPRHGLSDNETLLELEAGT